MTIADLAADFPFAGHRRPTHISPLGEAKRRAALLLLRRLPVPEVARRLEVSESLVYRWRRAARVKVAP